MYLFPLVLLLATCTNDLVIMIVYVTIYTDYNQNIFWPSLFE